MLSKFQTYSHSKTLLKYHLIFSTKYRRDCLSEIRESVIDSFRKIENTSDFKILEMEIDKNHIHFLVTFKPSLSITQVVRRLKQLSTYHIWKKEESFLRNFYWKKKVLWTKGYFCSTIGEVSEETLKNYIRNQGWKQFIY